MSKAKVVEAKSKSVVTESQLVEVRTESMALARPVLAEAALIQVTDAESYQLAGSFLAKILQARKRVAAKLNPIIQPIRAGLDLLYELRRELDTPLEQAEGKIKQEMKDWQVGEYRRIAQEREAKRREEARQLALAEAKRREAEELEAKASRARSAYARLKQEELAEQAREAAARLEQKAEIIAAAPVDEPTKAEGSTIRKAQKWRVTDLKALVAGVATGKVPLEVLEVSSKAVNAEMKADPDFVAGWPGVEVYDDIDVVGR